MEGKVYIVTEGPYSNYSIEAVYETRAEAERFVAQLAEDIGDVEWWVPRIEEWDLGDPQE